MEFFFYGTLMDDDVLSRVIGRRLPAALIEPGSLCGYERVYAAKAYYPVLVPRAGGMIHGYVVSGLTAIECQHIFAFEDEGYIAQTVSVRGIRGGETAALAFMPGPDMEITSQAWDYEDWRRRHKRLYMQRIWGKA